MERNKKKVIEIVKAEIVKLQRSKQSYKRSVRNKIERLQQIVLVVLVSNEGYLLKISIELKKQISALEKGYADFLRENNYPATRKSRWIYNQESGLTALRKKLKSILYIIKLYNETEVNKTL